MQMSPDPAEGRADLFRFLGFSSAGSRPAIEREVREAVWHRVHARDSWWVRETWWAIFRVGVAARVPVSMCPPDGTDTRPHAAISMPAG